MLLSGLLVVYFIFQPIQYSYIVENAFPNLTFNRPVGIYFTNDGTHRLFIVQQSVEIYIFNNSQDSSEKSLYLNIGAIIDAIREKRLLGLVFHPNYSFKDIVM